MEASVKEIHRYPLRPQGVEEPLFATGGFKRVVREHLAAAPWLVRASEIGGGRGESVHRMEEPARLERGSDGRLYLVRQQSGGDGSVRRCAARIANRTEIRFIPDTISHPVT